MHLIFWYAFRNLLINTWCYYLKKSSNWTVIMPGHREWDPECKVGTFKKASRLYIAHDFSPHPLLPTVRWLESGGPKYKYIFGVCLCFRWGPCAPTRKCAPAVLVGALSPKKERCVGCLGGGLCPKNKCLPAKGFLFNLKHNRVLLVLYLSNTI